jgi:hypothetical protein
MRLLKLFALLATLAAVAAAAAAAGDGWGPETPHFNLEAGLQPTAIGPEKGFGLVKFRQPNDGETRIYLDVWVRDLAPTQTYYFQRAVDMDQPDGVCMSQGWLTLGTISTDESGTGRAELSRLVPSTSIGTEFDIHFRVAETQTATSGVLESGCYQYTVSQ